MLSDWQNLALWKNLFSLLEAFNAKITESSSAVTQGFREEVGKLWPEGHMWPHELFNTAFTIEPSQ